MIIAMEGSRNSCDRQELQDPSIWDIRQVWVIPLSPPHPDLALRGVATQHQSQFIKYLELLITSWYQIQIHTVRIYIIPVSIFINLILQRPDLFFCFRQKEGEPFINKKQSNATIIQDKTRITTNGHKFTV